MSLKVYSTSSAVTGIVFHPVDGLAFAQALRRLLVLHGSPDWAAVQAAAMRQPVGWERSAADYAALYAGLRP